MKQRVPKSYRNLWVWQRGIAFTKEIYHLTEHITPRETAAVVLPLRRAAIAIPVSIARGVGIGRPGAWVRALFRAYVATQEIETHLHIACKLGLVPPQAADRARVTNDEIGETLLNMLSSIPLAQEFEAQANEPAAPAGSRVVVQKELVRHGAQVHRGQLTLALVRNPRVDKITREDASLEQKPVVLLEGVEHLA